MDSQQKTGERQERQINRKVAARWTEPLAAAGWVPVSNVFLDHYRHLPEPLSTHEVVLLLHILRHKWSHEAPWPSAKRLAVRMGISSTAARNHLRSLEKKGYLKKVSRTGMSNKLDITPLFAALEKLLVTIKENSERLTLGGSAVGV